ncbi:MAG TPA: M1 family metallopeptidase, partial [Chitinophagaceae bacterium]
TLNFIWFHLWPNAYKNDKTAFTDQTLINGDTRFYFSDKDQRGYINRLDFKVDNITCVTEDHPLYIDIIKVILPAPLPRGHKIILSTPFHVKLPFNFSRGGHDGESYQVTQWYPKPAVYDKNGWHPMPYLDQGEFYSEFGRFDVQITIPKNYVVAATGELQNPEEKQWLLTRKSFSWETIKQKTKSRSGTVKTTIQKFPVSSSETKTLRYTQNNVHDFAWFADKRFIVDQDTCMLPSGKTIDVVSYYTPQEKTPWKSSITYLKRAVRFYSSEVGEYPYNIVSTVQGPKSFGGGMEYPTITVISPTRDAQDLDITIAHEAGHNWFYGALGSNERDHPWMDEGINTFYEDQYKSTYYKDSWQGDRVRFETFAGEKLDQPIETPSAKFNQINYELIAYYKTSEWLRWLQQQLGKENLDTAMHHYFRQWEFRHPQPEDFKKAIEESTGKNLDISFKELDEKGTLPTLKRKGISLTVALGGDQFLGGPDLIHKDQITINPFAFGFNSYDKIMWGIIFTNYSQPSTRFKFLAIPMYAFGSKRITGLGKLDYSFYPNSAFRKIDLFLNGSTFTENRFLDSNGKKIELGFQKLVPGIRFTFKQKNPLSNLERYIQWKSFLIGEDGLNFSRDTLTSPPAIVTNITKTTDHWNLNQLLMVAENSRALYPYRAELEIEQSKDFVRAGFTGNYFFNYPKNGGLDVRFFAGKFFYTVSETPSTEFFTERYHLNMNGPNGFDDYTYSDYFIGRNKFDGVASQQIMMRDGGFKIKTDLLSSPVGETDNWLIAANFTSTIPRGINPLSILPVKIPLKIFVDVGTYAEAWKKDADVDHFLFDGGFEVSLLKNTINIYVPLIYSDVYKNYIQSILEKKNRFFRKISFNIDISGFSFKKFDKSIFF